MLLCILFFTGCSNTSNPPPSSLSASSTNAESSIQSSSSGNVSNSSVKVSRYSDLRHFKENFLDASPKSLHENEYVKEDIPTYTFNQNITFKGNEEYQKEVMETGKDPGLGIRSLHKQGITGKGVNVAIIDHPEFKGKIVKYFDSGCEIPEGQGSMHAPAVASLLVGDSIGVAPGANLYFAAAPSWERDSKYYADSLYWIIEENKKLPKGEKIKVVSVSAAPSGRGSLFEKNKEMWDEAVIKARAEEYEEGKYGHIYFGDGGLSWGIPYTSGVLALGWQINPSLTPNEIIKLLIQSSFVGDYGLNYIDPVNFINAVKLDME